MFNLTYEIKPNIIVDIYQNVINLYGFERTRRIVRNDEIYKWIKENLLSSDYWIESSYKDENVIDGLTLFNEEDFNLLKLVFGDRFTIKRRLITNSNIYCA